MEEHRRRTDGAMAAAATSGAALGGGVDGGARVNGVRLHWVEAGDPRAPLVVLLHGFPDFWYGWRHQLPALAAAGRRAVAVDLRGYNLSERPPRVEDYRRDVLAADVAALIRHLGAPAASVVGHDWGGVIAWHLAATHPEVVDRLVVLNAPHPARFRELVRSPRQALRSWYVGFFQLPWLPERLLRLGGGAALERLWRGEHRRPGAFDARDSAAYHAAFAEPAALTAPLHYYRALLRRAPTRPADHRPLPHETLLIWAMRDAALVNANAEGLERWVPRLRVVRVAEAAHFVMSDAPEPVNGELVGFLGRR